MPKCCVTQCPRSFSDETDVPAGWAQLNFDGVRESLCPDHIKTTTGEERRYADGTPMLDPGPLCAKCTAHGPDPRGPSNCYACRQLRDPIMREISIYRAPIREIILGLGLTFDSGDLLRAMAKIAELVGVDTERFT